MTGTLAFDLTNGDSASPNNTVSIMNFLTDGALIGSSNTNTLGATGDLPGSVTITDAEFFNESTRQITFGTILTFDLTLTENYTGPGLFDQFSLFLLDDAGVNSLITTDDPVGSNALFAIDISGAAGGNVVVFTPTTPGVALIVPEPSASSLLFAGLLAGGLWGKGRRTLKKRIQN